MILLKLSPRIRGIAKVDQLPKLKEKNEYVINTTKID